MFTATKGSTNAALDRATGVRLVSGHPHPLHALAEARMHEASYEIFHACSSARAAGLQREQSNRLEATHRSRRPRLAGMSRRSRPRSANAAVSMCAQGDILLERVGDGRDVNGVAEIASVTLAHGELSGHRHTVHGRVGFICDAALAPGVPKELYLGHLLVLAGPALLEHDQHGSITLPAGTYCVRRQRHLEPADAVTIGD